MRAVLRGGFAPLGLLVLAAILFEQLLTHPAAIIADADRPSVDRAVPAELVSLGNDATRLFLPHHMRIADNLNRTGHIPSWDPFGFGGRPLIGNPQGGLWYPPTWLVWKFWTPSALGWATVAHLVWGGLGIFVLLRSYGVGRFASWIAGATWLSAPYVLAQTYEGHYPHAWAASWISWTFWAASGKRKAWLVPPFLALGFLAGHPQETYYLALALGVWIGIRSLARLRDRQPVAFLQLTIAGAIVAVVVLGLLAIEWVPDVRAQSFTLKGAKLASRGAGKYHVFNLNLIQLLSPRALGGPANYFGPGSYWEPLLAVGFVPLVLIVLAVRSSPRWKIVLGWSALALVAIWFAFGPRLGLFPLAFAIVPGMNRFRVPARALFLATTAASVLVGLGIEAVAQPIKPGTSFLRGYRVGVAGLVLVLVCAWSNDPGSRLQTDFSVWTHAAARIASDPVFWLALGGTTLGLEWMAKKPRDGRKIAVFLGFLAVVELGFYGHDLIHVSPASRWLGSDDLSRAIAKVRPSQLFRVRSRDIFFDDLRAYSQGLEKTNCNDSFQIQHAADFYEVLYPLFGGNEPPRLVLLSTPEIQTAVLERMNVGLLITNRDDPRIAWPIAVKGETFVVRKNPHLLPRAYVVPRAEVLGDNMEILGRMGQVSARDAVFLPEDPLPALGPRQTFREASYQSVEPDQVELRVKTEAPGFLVVADTWMPGWSARVDGRDETILRGDGMQRVVPIRKAGEHRVVMRFVPPGFATGRTITLATVAVWAMGWLGSCWWFRNRPTGR